ncbi:Kiwa anti-phage protein KwaB-like domain-containing protein [Klebsiella sp. ZJOU C1]|uniref:Kiwa anti-phage protein KwaB-like domain-containing protein n=1 Tax=Klebsiella sp. ZJOU C1 TaxID=3111629 RepID=UPI002D79AC37|nr:Kiwa anti-phage protein KwaB-like domain-containing protein [Klebsiella sp. ZJOU C1]WRR61849.1 Kiwa anti-phage protein KwaB-like domain-containing protein [Klebsiella sp. ZJOU C1]
MLKLDELLEYAEQLKEDDKAKISLYFVTRHLKNGMSKAAKVTDKYDFKVIKAPIAPDIAKFFKNTLSNQIISHASKDDIEMKNYTVIDDDIDNKIYAYAMNNAISFSKVINEDIKNDKPKVLTSLTEIQEDLWAYCIKVQKNSELTYSFRKISKGKVTTNEPQDVVQRIFALFDKSDKELRSFDGSAVNFDDKIDCIYIKDQFYVFHKKSFESIVGLEAEFTEAAQRTLNTIKEFDLVEGLDIIEQAILHKPSLRKILAHIAEKGNHTSLDRNEVTSMNSVLKMFQNEEFTINNDGRIVIEDEKQGRNFLRLLNDYYKQGMTTKKYYGTDSGNLVSPVTK